MSQTITTKIADEIANWVISLTWDVINKSKDKIIPFCYAGSSFEKWIVHETFAAIYNEWNWISKKNWYSSEWGSYTEIILPFQKSPRKHIDLFVGPYEKFPPKDSEDYCQPLLETPVFEFKMLRDDDSNDGKNSIYNDCQKLRKAKLLNGYIIALYFWDNTKRKKLDETRKNILGNSLIKSMNFKEGTLLSVPYLEDRKKEFYKAVLSCELLKIKA